jgi:1-aminocyclopropane-1-carboxylate deaminase/D-cysteine desulfhydrase-like pyridoxal-dependent ACC family enzyme
MEFPSTPIQEIKGNKNRIFIKRDDLLPFNFGGNKTRIAEEFLDNMLHRNCSCMVGYGNARSNLSRALAGICFSRGIKCYIISPDEYNTLDGYDTSTLYYSSDNYVLDSDCHIMSNAEISRTIGHDPYGHFGEYEDDSVHVRNDKLRCDYEVLQSMKTHTEIMEG